MLTVKEVATQLRVTETTVRNWIDEGKLKAYRVGTVYRIEKADFESFLNKSKIS